MRHVIDSENRHGEWSVGHRTMGFRICAFRHRGEGVHVHDRMDEVVGSLPPMTKEQAMRATARYAARHDWLFVGRLADMVQEVLCEDQA